MISLLDMMAVFKRKIYDELLRWKETYNGTKALRVEGARRVGKTTIVEEFARREYDSYILIDFSKGDAVTRDIIANRSMDLDVFFLHIQALYGTDLHRRRSLIVFDEVQLFPPARQMIKHLVADGRYDYIETGSLLSIRQNGEAILVPSGERVGQMHPMDFEEFLWARGDTRTVPMLRDAFDRRAPLGFEMHRRVMELYTMYMLVGGMPESVDALLSTGSYSGAEDAKREILDVYDNDLPKTRGGTKAKGVFDRIPSMLSKHGKSFKPGDVRRGSKTRDYLDAVVWLRESGMVNVCCRCTDPGPAPDMTLDEMSFKIYMADTGLLFTKAFESNGMDRGEIYRMMIEGKMNVNGGMFFENAVAQELTALGYRLAFSRFETAESENSQEVDFLITGADGGLPVEVKSGDSSRHRSLDRFLRKYSEVADSAVVIHGKDLRVDGNVLYIPIYMTMFLGRKEEKPLPEPAK